MKRINAVYMVSVLFFLFALIGCQQGGGAAVNAPPPSGPDNDSLSVKDCKRCIALTEQSQPAIVIVDINQNKTVWAWNPYHASDIKDPDWFSNPDEAKPVYGGNYMLITASGGGVALIRIADKKVVFQAYTGGNPHSAEILPDGNIVSASSTGNYLRVFHVDTIDPSGDIYSKKITIPFGHNVVWDKKRKRLWSAAGNTLYAYQYNFNLQKPDLSLADSLQLPGNDAHDLFPVYGKDALWLTNTSAVYRYEVAEERVHLVSTTFQKGIKSVSSGPEDFPTLIMKPREQWWSDRVLDLQGNVIFQHPGFKIYKARWFIENNFSYAEGNELTSSPR